MTPELVRAARRDQRTPKQMESDYPVGHQALRDIKARKTWAWVPDDGPVARIRTTDENNFGEHPRGAGHYKARLQPEDVIAIRRDHRHGREIAAEYGITQSHVWNIQNFRIWKHLPP